MHIVNDIQLCCIVPFSVFCKSQVCEQSQAKLKVAAWKTGWHLFRVSLCVVLQQHWAGRLSGRDCLLETAYIAA